MPPRAARIVDDDDGDQPVARVTGPNPWEKPKIAKQVQEILDAVEVPAIDAETRASFHRAVYRQKYFPTEDVEGHIILTLRCILESQGNEDAIREPIIVGAVSTSIYNFADRGLALVEAFDRIPLTAILETMRGLRIFGEKSLSSYMAISLRNKLYDILEPDQAKPSKPVKVKAAPKPPRQITRIPAIERKIALGLQLLELRLKTKGNIEFGKLRRRLGVEPVSAQEALRVAAMYGQNPAIYRRLTWAALVALTAPSLPVHTRIEIEAEIVAGRRFSHAQIRARRTTNQRLPKMGPSRGQKGRRREPNPP